MYGNRSLSKVKRNQTSQLKEQAFPVLECVIYYSIETYLLNNKVRKSLSGHFCLPPAASRLLVTSHQSFPEEEKWPLVDLKSV